MLENEGVEATAHNIESVFFLYHLHNTEFNKKTLPYHPIPQIVQFH